MSHNLRGNHLCGAIMAACRDNPATAAELAQRFDLKRDAALYWTTGLTRVGLLHVVEWRKGAQGPRVGVYAFGAGESAAPLTERKTRRVGMSNLAALGAMWEQLAGWPASQADICEASGMAVGTVRRLLVAMREAKLVRIAAWLPRVGCGGTPTPMYQAGADADAPKPKPKASKVHSKAYYWRRKTAGHQARELLRIAANSAQVEQAA